MQVKRTYRTNGQRDKVYFYNEDGSLNMVCIYDPKTDVECKRWVYESDRIVAKYFKHDDSILSKIEYYDKTEAKFLENGEPAIKIFGEYGKIIEKMYAKNGKLYSEKEFNEMAAKD